MFRARYVLICSHAGMLSQCRAPGRLTQSPDNFRALIGRQSWPERDPGLLLVNTLLQAKVVAHVVTERTVDTRIYSNWTGNSLYFSVIYFYHRTVKQVINLSEVVSYGMKPVK